MKHLPIFFAALLSLTSEASAACVDDMRKLADQSFAFNEATTVDGRKQRSAEGNEFMVYFDKPDEEMTEKKVEEPNNKDSGGGVVAIRSNIYGEGGRSHYRISFMNRFDFVIRAIHDEYEGRIVYPRGAEVLQTTSTDYMFSAGALQIPKDVAGIKDEAAYKKDAEKDRGLFFDAPELVSYLSRIKQ